jgi:conjugative relaxase-like TrwC/TraI family protein
VLSIGKLGVGQASYYLSSVASGVEDYYTGSGEAAGRWVGFGCDALGLSGEVVAEDLHAVLSGLDPRSGAMLGSQPRRVPGFDLTFSAPKSVSVLFGLGDHPIRAATIAAHEAAVDAAVGFVEREALRGRRRRGGSRRVVTQGAVAAAFRHRSSRAGDPQLHTHVLVANLVQGDDGQWGALDGRELYRFARTAGFLYQAHLRAGLSESLGVRWRRASRGTAEVVGVPQRVLRLFSRRRAEIEAALLTEGRSSMRAAQVATLATRRAKEYMAPGADLHGRWAERATELGWDPASLAAVVGHDREATGEITDETLAAALVAEASTFDRRDALRLVAETTVVGATIDAVEARADRLLASPAVLELAGGGRFSTPELVGIEARLVESAAARRMARAGVARDEDVVAAIAARPSLSGEQVAMVRRLTTSGAGVEVVVGRAGAGKTFALDAARAAWQASGVPVWGCALAARAAAELQSSAGIAAFTVDGLLADLATPTGAGLLAGGVLVVDEAGMVGTRKLAALADHTAAVGAKLVLVGDPRQLPEIDAGGAFAHLADRLGVVELSGNLRQRDPAERAALAAYRSGRVADAVAMLADAGRVVTADNADLLRARLVAEWAEHYAAGLDCVILTLRRSDAETLNALARAALDRPTGPQIVAGGREFAVGDRVIALRNRRRLGLLNGVRGTVERVDVESRALDVRLDTGGVVRVPSWYLDEGWLAHGYAFTIHKAQGLTCDVAFLVGDDHLYAEAGYTGLSRARLENRLYVVDAQPDDELAHGAEVDAADPLAAATMAMSRSRAKQLALDVDPAAADVAALAERDLDELRAERDTLARRIDNDVAPLRTAAATVAAEHYDVRQQLRALPADAARRGELVERLAALDTRRRDIAAATAAWNDDHADDRARLKMLVRACRAVARRAARTVVHSPGRYIDIYGARPERPVARARWVDALRRHALYEAEHGVRLDTALDRSPVGAARDRRHGARAVDATAGREQ